jgi:ADP-ribose pyrophosphatase
MEYLSRLPDDLRTPGAPGEIQLVAGQEAEERAAAVANFLHHRAGLPLPNPALGVVYEDPFFFIIREAVSVRGRVGAYQRIVPRETSGSSAAVLTVRGDEMWFVRPYRHSTRRFEIECPRGHSPEAKTPEDAAGHEVLQELGLPLISLQQLIPDFCTDTGITTNRVPLYLGVLGEGVPNPAPEMFEVFGEPMRVPLRDLRQVVANGSIRDSFTLGALAVAWAQGYLADATKGSDPRGNDS